MRSDYLVAFNKIDFWHAPNELKYIATELSRVTKEDSLHDVNDPAIIIESEGVFFDGALDEI